MEEAESLIDTRVEDVPAGALVWPRSSARRGEISIRDSYWDLDLNLQGLGPRDFPALVLQVGHPGAPPLLLGPRGQFRLPRRSRVGVPR